MSNPGYTDERAPIAEVPTITFALLEAKDVKETQRLLEACQTLGFFHLNFKGSEKAGTIVDDKNALIEFMKYYFHLPEETKMLDKCDYDIAKGFTPVGAFTGVEKGSRECFERLAIMRDDLLRGSPETPAAVQQRSALFHRYTEVNTYVMQVLLERLSEVLQGDGGAPLDLFDPPSESSTTRLSLLSYPKHGSSHHAHTDIGVLTIVFAGQWGLQVIPPETGEWTFVRPNAEHAIVNVGDTLRFMTKSQVYSCVHRVIRATGSYEVDHRYSVAFFLRAADERKLRIVDGRQVSARQWADQKYELFASSHQQQEGNPVMTGGMASILSQPKAVAVSS